MIIDIKCMTEAFPSKEMTAMFQLLLWDRPGKKPTHWGNSIKMVGPVVTIFIFNKRLWIRAWYVWERWVGKWRDWWLSRELGGIWIRDVIGIKMKSRIRIGFKTMPIHNTADGNMTRSWIQLLSTVGMRVKKEKFDHRAVFLVKKIGSRQPKKFRISSRVRNRPAH